MKNCKHHMNILENVKKHIEHFRKPNEKLQKNILKYLNKRKRHVEHFRKPDDKLQAPYENMNKCQKTYRTFQKTL